MNGRLIVDLPTSSSASIISEWLSVKDRVRLDSAHCQASVRDEFLQLNRSPELSMKTWVHNRILLINRALVPWALLRQVYVEKVSVESEGNLDLYNAYLQKFGNRVFVLRVYYSKTASLAQSIANCRNLLVLKVYNRMFSASLRDVFVCCEKLREFCGYSSISRLYSTEPDPSDPPLTNVHLETVVCNNLKYLQLTNRDMDLVAAILRMAVAVEVVVLATEDVPLNGIPESMSSTASTLSLDEITLDASLANFAPRGEQLQNLCFQWCNVADSAISALCKFPNLRALDLTHATFESEDYLSVLASSCGDMLTELLMYGCEPTLSLVTVQEVLPQFSRLESLCFEYDDDNTAAWNMSSFSRLTKLSTCYYGDSDIELVGQLTEHCYVNLRELNLAVALSELVSDELDDLVSTCTNLHVLHLHARTNRNDQDEAKYWCTSEDEEEWRSLRPGLAVTIGKDEREHKLRVFEKFDNSGVW